MPVIWEFAGDEYSVLSGAPYSMYLLVSFKVKGS